MGDSILHITGTETSSGVGMGLRPNTNTIVGLFVDVSAISGTDTPTLVVKLQHSPNSTNGLDGDWYDVAGMTTANITSVSNTQILPILNPEYTASTARVAWTITGTSPSFTFEAVFEQVS